MRHEFEQPPHMRLQSQDHRTAGAFIRPQPLEHARPIMQRVRAHVHRGFVPFDEPAVLPDPFGFRDGHRTSKRKGLPKQKFLHPHQGRRNPPRYHPDYVGMVQLSTCERHLIAITGSSRHRLIGFIDEVPFGLSQGNRRVQPCHSPGGETCFRWHIEGLPPRSPFSLTDWLTTPAQTSCSYSAVRSACSNSSCKWTQGDSNPRPSQCH